MLGGFQLSINTVSIFVLPIINTAVIYPQMAKLDDGKKWLEMVLGDSGRTNSLIVKGRDKGLYTKGKRGGVAPELVLSDFIALLLSALSSAAPSNIKESVCDFQSLHITDIEFKHLSHSRWGRYSLTENLPEKLLKTLEFHGIDMRNVDSYHDIDLLSVLKSVLIVRKPRKQFFYFDKLELRERGPYRIVSLTLHEVDSAPSLNFGNSRGISSDPRDWYTSSDLGVKLIFNNKRNPTSRIQMHSTRTITSVALNALASLAFPEKGAS